LATNFEFFSIFCVSIISLITSLIISCNISSLISNHILVSKISPENRAVLITGCDTGFGHQLAIEIDKLGFHVFAGVLFPDGIGAKNLQFICSERLKVLKMDVTNYEEVSEAINQIKSSGIQLWAVVNNAGIAINTPIEWGHDVNELSKMLSVNVYGMVRVTKLSMPLLRQSKGRIINVTSVAGKVFTIFFQFLILIKKLSQY